MYCRHYHFCKEFIELLVPATFKWIIAFFSQQSKLVMEGFRSLKEGEQVEFTYKKSCKGLESLRVTGPGGGPCAGSERRPKGKVPLQKRKPKGDRWVWYNLRNMEMKKRKVFFFYLFFLNVFCVCRNIMIHTHQSWLHPTKAEYVWVLAACIWKAGLL